LARYVLPSVDEWYKAAYYDPTSGIYNDYPTGSDSVPDGIDFAGDPNFDAVFFDGGSNPQPNDITSVGLLNPFGTAGQGGNVWEWEETDSDLVNDLMSELPGNHRVSRSSCWFCFSDSMLSSFRSRQIPSNEDPNIGLRVASDPRPPIPVGDYNKDEAVDAADYVVWRKLVGYVVGPCSGPDANCNGFVEVAEYQPWRENFGRTLGDAASAIGSEHGGLATNVPEPSSLRLIALMMKAITPGNADDFKQWLVSRKLAPTTIHKRLQVARSFFHAMQRRKLIGENPFEGVKAVAVGIKDRQRFVTREETALVLAACPNHHWKSIVALARYGGLRCPSEVLSLRWQDVLWDAERIVVTSPKTEHHAGKASRTIPLFPELREILDEAFDLAPDGAVYVVDEKFRKSAMGPAGWMNANLRTTFEKIVKRAGLTQWPRLFHNLRASRETELVEK
jgi:hypothetical protein